MADQQPVDSKPLTGQMERLPEGIARDVRMLSHDLSNALEIVVQTSYLLTTVGLTEPASNWLKMLEEGVNRSLELNNTLRLYIREHSASPAVTP